MALGDLANLGEFLGGIAVIASLLFVGFQIRQTRVVMVRASEREWYRDNTAAVQHAASSPGMAEIWVRGVTDYASLGSEEAWRFDAALYTWLAAFEMAFHDRSHGLGDPETARVHRHTLKQIMSLPGVGSWWQHRSRWFDRAFQAEIQEIREDASLAPEHLVR